MNRQPYFNIYAVVPLFFLLAMVVISAYDFNASFDIGDSQIWDKPAVALKGKAEGGLLRLPNPFVSCDSMEEAARMAGFDMVLPKIPDRLEVLKGVMIQAFYGENRQDMLVRKARGEGDISGDYNHYAQVETIDGITVKGENNAFFLAVWARDGYAYFISVSQALFQPELLALVAVVQ